MIQKVFKEFSENHFTPLIKQMQMKFIYPLKQEKHSINNHEEDKVAIPLFETASNLPPLILFFVFFPIVLFTCSFIHC